MQISERDKGILVAALAVVFVAVAWWRLGGAARGGGGLSMPDDISVPIVVPQVDPALYRLTEARPGAAERGTREILRNPFAFPAPIAPVEVAPAEGSVEAKPPVVRAEYQLRGVMRSGSRVSADINGRLYDIGERVGRFTVTAIGSGQVTLAFGDRTYTLEIGESIVER